MKGFIYVAQNNSMPGLLKIGRTDRVPDTRMAELFSTGVPEPFQIVYYAITSDAKNDEVRVHQVLSRFRHRENREFFAVASISAIGAIKHLCEVELDWRNSELDASANEDAAEALACRAIDSGSRGSVEAEENELDEFMQELSAVALEAFVVSAFYDSNACICNIALADGVDEFSEVAEHVYAIAEDTLSQFEMFGRVWHGRGLNELGADEL